MSLPDVENNIPIPEHVLTPKKISRVYGYDRLAVGQSLWFPGKTETNIKQSFSNYRAEAKLPLWRAVYEVKTENNVLGVRMWRVADEKPKGETSKLDKQYERTQGSKGWKDVLREGDPGKID